jgi:hypothetical protein
MVLANRGVPIAVLEALLEESKRILKFHLSLLGIDDQQKSEQDCSSRASDLVRAAGASAQLDVATIAATSDDADSESSWVQRFHILVVLERCDRSSSPDEAYGALCAALMAHTSGQVRSPLRTSMVTDLGSEVHMRRRTLGRRPASLM